MCNRLHRVLLGVSHCARHLLAWPLHPPPVLAFLEPPLIRRNLRSINCRTATGGPGHNSRQQADLSPVLPRGAARVSRPTDLTRGQELVLRHTGRDGEQILRRGMREARVA